MPDHHKVDRAMKSEKRITVEFSSDKIEAYIILGATPKLAPTTEKELREELAREGIVGNLINENINRLATTNTPGVRTLVARGTPPTPGVDGRIEYFFDFESMGKPRLNELGKADHKNINLVINVKKGQRLAKIHPPVSGSPGKTVTGEEIAPPQPKEAILAPGVGAAFSSEDPRLIVAIADGAVSVGDGTIRVDPVLEIPGNVDYSTGNIDFTGTLTIKGDVKSGFSVKSGGNLIIMGTVEDAELHAGGDISVFGGSVGSGKGVIAAAGSVFVRFAERLNISARRNIVVEEYLLNCNVRAGSAVKATGKQGIILGGETGAAVSVTAKLLGNDKSVQTRIIVGYSDEVLAQLKELEKRERQALENTKKVRKGFDILKRIKIIKKNLPEDKKLLLEKLAEMAKKLQAVIEDCRRIRAEILANNKTDEPLTVAALEAAHPGVLIFFRETGYRVEKKEERVTFKFIGGEIQKAFTF